jgi:hypothetical protein
MNTPSPIYEQQIRDAEHLKILAICHYVLGTLTVAFSTLFLLHFFLGLSLLLHPSWLAASSGQTPPPFFGYFLMLVGGAAVLSGWITGGLQIYSGRMLQQHKRRLFSTVVAALSCASVPMGTALGVFTLIVLARPSVKQLYQPAIAGPQPLLAAAHDETEENVWRELEDQAKE